jgi:hypothetical protein
VQAEFLEPAWSPSLGLAGAQVAALALDQQALEPPRDVAVDLDELVGGIAGAKVVPG